MLKRHIMPQGWRNVAVILLTFSLSACGGGTVSTGTNSGSGSSGGSTSVGTTGTFGIMVSGNQFVSTKTGEVVQIVGTNISGLEGGGYNTRWAQFGTAGSAFWSQVVNWGNSGLNTVRLPLNEANWLNYNCYDAGTGSSAMLYKDNGDGSYKPDPNSIYQDTVKQAVADATAAGLYVILDLHWASPNNDSGQPICPIGQPGFPDADHSVTFWTQVANAFKDNPAVIFELFNEPYGSNDYNQAVVQNGSTYSPGPAAMMLYTGGSFSPFTMQDNPNGNNITSFTDPSTYNVASEISLLNAIRATGATNVVLASPMHWAGEIETWLGIYTTDGNPDPLKQFGVAWHAYNSYTKGPAPPLAVLDAGYPIVITETYVFSAALDGSQNADGYTWAASHGIGYLWWGWNDWNNGPLSDNLSNAPWYVSGIGP